MKISAEDLKKIVSRSVDRVLEGRRPKEVLPESPESETQRGSIATRALPGYQNSKEMDFSKPLGRKSRPKKQGRANIGPWTSESTELGRGNDERKRLLDILISHRVNPAEAAAIAEEIMSSGSDSLSGFSTPLGIEESIRILVRSAVEKKIPVRR